MDKNFRISLSEVSDILNHMDKTDKDKISHEFLKFIEENKEKDYKPLLDYSKEINDMKLNKNTRAILAIIYIKFWCNAQQKKDFLHILNENEKKHQELMRKKYNPNDVIKKRASKKNND